MIFCERLIELRNKFGMTQEQLGNRIGYSRRTVSAWETGAKLPTFDAIVALAQFFGVSADYMLGMIDNADSAAKF
jgi:transcriptional regulator with XRE-family HTH domain